MRRSGDEKIRVLHVIGRMTRAGAETLLMHVLRNIDRDRFHTDLVVHTTEPGAYDEEVRSLGGQVIPCLTPSRPRTYARNLTRILKENGPYDIIHSHIHHYSGFVLHIAQQAGIPGRVVHSHKGKCLGGGVALQRRVYLSLARCLIERHATAGIAVSRSAAEDLFGAGWESDPRWRVLRLGIDLSPFREPVDREAVRAEFGIPPDAFVIGHVGRFAPEKNHRMLLQIATEMVKHDPRTRLLLVGDGPLMADVEQRAKELGLADRVVFAGVRTDTARLMMGAINTVVFPSLYEGMPLALVEAQSAGVPCVISGAIGQEVDVVGRLVHRVSLSLPATKWAGAVLEARESARMIPREEALAAAESGPLNIRNSIIDLERFYHEAARG